MLANIWYKYITKWEKFIKDKVEPLNECMSMDNSEENLTVRKTKISKLSTKDGTEPSQPLKSCLKKPFDVETDLFDQKKKVKFIKLSKIAKKYIKEGREIRSHKQTKKELQAIDKPTEDDLIQIDKSRRIEAVIYGGNVFEYEEEQDVPIERPEHDDFNVHMNQMEDIEQELEERMQHSV